MLFIQQKPSRGIKKITKQTPKKTRFINLKNFKHMGNRAVLKFIDEQDQPSIYLHWNGGRASVQAFLNVAKELSFRADSYGVARMCQIVGNFFGGNLSLGCNTKAFDPGDNGIYLIKDFEIVGRENFDGEEEIDENGDNGIYLIEKTKSMTDFILDLHKKIDEARKELSESEKYKK